MIKISEFIKKTNNVWSQHSSVFDALMDPHILTIFFGLIFVLLTTVILIRIVAQIVTKKPDPSIPKTDLCTKISNTHDDPTPLALNSTNHDDPIEDVKNTDQAKWIERLNAGLKKTRTSLETNLTKLFKGSNNLDEQILEELHEVLFRSDLGVQTTNKLVEHVSKSFHDKEKNIEAIKKSLYERSKEILDSNNSVPMNSPTTGPKVILIVGVNGVGKTTTIGKLAAHYISQNQSVLLCAADTFRAAAIDQLKIWGERLGVQVIAHQQGSDPAAVAYDGVKAAISRKADILIIDTAGRLHNKSDLMAELSKIKKVIGKDLEAAPHETWLVIDATTGQNAFQQVKSFNEVAQLTGVIVTKLDGTAKGGVLIGISDQFKHPIRYIGVGEKASDLQSFNTHEYLASLFLNSENTGSENSASLSTDTES